MKSILKGDTKTVTMCFFLDASRIPLDIKTWENTINVFFFCCYITEKEQDSLIHHDSCNILDERRMLNGEFVYSAII